jgi:hypothetical protein
MNEGDRHRLARVAAHQLRMGETVDNGWDTLRMRAIGSLWGRGTSAAVQIVGAEPWALRAEVTR